MSSVYAQVWDRACSQYESGQFRQSAESFRELIELCLAEEPHSASNRAEVFPLLLALRAASAFSAAGKHYQATAVLAERMTRAGLGDTHARFRCRLGMASVALSAEQLDAAVQHALELRDESGPLVEGPAEQWATGKLLGRLKRLRFPDSAMTRVRDDGAAAAVVLARISAGHGRYLGALGLIELALNALGQGPGENELDPGETALLGLELAVEGGVTAPPILLEVLEGASLKQPAIRDKLRVLRAHEEWASGELSAGVQGLQSLWDSRSTKMDPRLGGQVLCQLAFFDLVLNRLTQAEARLAVASSLTRSDPGGGLALDRRWETLAMWMECRRSGGAGWENVPLALTDMWQCGAVERLTGSGHVSPMTEKLDSELPGRQRVRLGAELGLRFNRMVVALTAGRDIQARADLEAGERFAAGCDSPRLKRLLAFQRVVFLAGTGAYAEAQALKIASAMGSLERFHAETWLERAARSKGLDSEASRHSDRARGMLAELAEGMNEAERRSFLLNKDSVQDGALRAGLSGLERSRKQVESVPAVLRWYFSWLHSRTKRRVLSALPPLLSLEQELLGGAGSLLPERKAEGSKKGGRCSSEQRGSLGSTLGAWGLHLLPRHVVIVRYAMLPESLQAFRITRGKVDVFRSSVSRVELFERVSSLALRLRRQQETLAVARVVQESSELSRLLGIPELLDGLGQGVRRLVVVPDEFLVCVPFAALMPGRQEFVADRLVVSVWPGSRLPPDTRRAEVRPDSFTSVGVGECGRPGFESLAGVITEVSSVSTLMKEQGVSTRLLVNAEATPQAAVSALRTCDWGHLACHGTFDPARLGDAGLELYGSTAAEGRLSVAALARRTFRRLKLLTVSSCWGGGLAVLPGRRIAGLPVAFMESGVVRVVAPLWPVADGLAAQFLVEFYRAALKEGPVAALGRVQREWAHGEDEEKRAPVNWAAYTSYGGI